MVLFSAFAFGCCFVDLNVGLYSYSCYLFCDVLWCLMVGVYVLAVWVCLV